MREGWAMNGNISFFGRQLSGDSGRFEYEDDRMHVCVFQTHAAWQGYVEFPRYPGVVANARDVSPEAVCHELEAMVTGLRGFLAGVCNAR